MTPDQPLLRGPHDCRYNERQADYAQRAMGRAAMKAQVVLRSSGAQHDVDVGGVRGKEQRGGRAAPRTAERRTRKRQAEQAVRQIVQAI